MAKRKPSKASIAAKKGWATRRKAARARSAAAKKSAATRNAEKAQIEKLLGEEFESLREARAELKAQSVPVAGVPITADQWDDFYDYGEYEDAGEYEGGVDYGEE